MPRLTDDQREALDLIETIANDPAFHVEMDFQPGDVQLLNNAVILHSREAYEDDDDPDQRRHLLRLWLQAHDFASVETKLRAGVPSRASGSPSWREWVACQRLPSFSTRSASVDGVDGGSGGLSMVELFSLSECSLKPNISEL